MSDGPKHCRQPIFNLLEKDTYNESEKFWKTIKTRHAMSLQIPQSINFAFYPLIVYSPTQHLTHFNHVL